jgi:thioesterase domain-containing protein
MIDTIRPRLAPLDAREYAWYHLGAAAAIADARERIPYLRQRVKPLLHRMAPRWSDGTRQMMQRAGLRRSAPPPREKPTDPLMVSVHTAYLNYHPTPVTFPVSLFATRQSMARAVEPALRWNGWLHAGFELVEIPGHHATLWDDEHVGALAAALRASLARRRDAAGC